MLTLIREIQLSLKHWMDNYAARVWVCSMHGLKTSGWSRFAHLISMVRREDCKSPLHRSWASSGEECVGGIQAVNQGSCR